MSRRDVFTPRLFVVLVVAATVTLAPLLAGPMHASAALGGADTEELSHTTIAVSQNGQCWQVSPYGDGTENVTDFYDYRSPKTDPPANGWGSYGTGDLQRNQGSMLLFYEGVDGTSMVMVHDEIDEPHGGTVTFDFTGLPESGEWVVEDDPYPDREDNWDFFDNGTTADIDWKWSSGRSDGGAFRGLEDANESSIRLEPGFNERADKWDTWGYARGDNRTEGWYLRSGEGGVQELNTRSPVEISTGECPDGPTPMVTLDHEVVRNGTAMRFNADASYSEGSVDAYQWDLDGDGEVDRTTDLGLLEHRFNETGLQGVTVTAVADDGSESSVSELLTVNESLTGETNGTDETTTPGANTTTPEPNTTTAPGTTPGTTTAVTTDTPTDTGSGTTEPSGDDGTGTVGATATDAGTDSQDGGSPGPGPGIALAVLLVTVLCGALRRRRS